MNQPRFQTLKYRAPTGAFNLGDAIQAVALARLLGEPSEGVNRDSAGQADPDRLFVVSGWLGDRSVPERGQNTLFAGIHVGACHAEQLQWIHQSRFPVGARDPFTQEMLAREGIHSEMVGCVSLTLERYAGPRSGRYSVDASETDTIELSQHLPGLNWDEQVAMAQARLETLRTAEIVYTSRLHVALPCLAFGTPVVVRPPQFQPERFTLFDSLGGVYHEPITLDVSGPADRFKAFLRRGLESHFNQDWPLFESENSIMANNPKHQAILRKVERALKTAGSIIVAVRIEGGKVHCDLDVQTFPNDDIDIATDLIISALDNHKARLSEPQKADRTAEAVA